MMLILMMIIVHSNVDQEPIVNDWVGIDIDVNINSKNIVYIQGIFNT